MTNKIKLPVVVYKGKANGKWVVFCPPLKTFGYSAASEDDAFTDFDEAIRTFFYVHTKRGTLDTTLSNFGFQKKGLSEYQSPVISSALPVNSKFRNVNLKPVAVC